MDKETLAMILTAFLVFVLFVFVPPYFEAQTFNKFSSKQATYWDALFADLRVMADGK